MKADNDSTGSSVNENLPPQDRETKLIKRSADTPLPQPELLQGVEKRAVSIISRRASPTVLRNTAAVSKFRSKSTRASFVVQTFRLEDSSAVVFKTRRVRHIVPAQLDVIGCVAAAGPPIAAGADQGASLRTSGGSREGNG